MKNKHLIWLFLIAAAASPGPTPTPISCSQAQANTAAALMAFGTAGDAYNKAPLINNDRMKMALARNAWFAAEATERQACQPASKPKVK